MTDGVPKFPTFATETAAKGLPSVSTSLNKLIGEPNPSPASVAYTYKLPAWANPSQKSTSNNPEFLSPVASLVSCALEK